MLSTRFAGARTSAATAARATKRSLVAPLRSNASATRSMANGGRFASTVLGGAMGSTILKGTEPTHLEGMSFSTASNPNAFGTQTTAAELGLSIKDPKDLSGSNPHKMFNLVNGEWVESAKYVDTVDPWNGEAFIQTPDTTMEELPAFVKSSKQCPKTGLHNPLKNPHRYQDLARVSNKAGELLRGNMGDYFARLIQRVSPKSYTQAMGEVTIAAQFLENFSGDQIRFMTSSFGVAGDHTGQMSTGYRWPYGPCALITPFNFPLEIPVLQLMGALFMGNRVTLKVDSKVSVVMEQFLQMLHACGLPKTDVDYINCDGEVMGRFIRSAKPRNTQFTGSSRTAEKLAKVTHGKVKLEDAGFDWKILGPDAPVSRRDPLPDRVREEVDYVAWQCDQDAYACSGQKCSAQSILFAHKKWTTQTHLLQRMQELAERRTMQDQTVGPVLSWTTDAMLEHMDNLLQIDGAKVLWGGKPLKGHSIPPQYGAIEPTAIYVPFSKLKNKKNFELATTEVFAPFQVITDYETRQIPYLLRMLERMSHHLTAAVVSKDERFRNQILGHTVNGTTYSGIRARTTGAPQNHWFGPAGDPRGAGIGTPEAIKLVWSCHREIISDIGPVPSEFQIPPAT